MRWTLTRLLVAIILFTCLYSSVQGQQGFSFSCSRDTTIAGCATNPCFTLKSIIPDIRAVSDSYYVNRINAPGACMPVYANPAVPGTPGNVVEDDTYSATIPIGFPFIFYGATYNNLVIGSNGAVSFNISLANQDETYQLPANLANSFYDGSLIMGPYHDIDLEDIANTSPARLLHYTTVGAAPNRKWVVSFYKIPLFYGLGSPTCPGLIENTSQIVLYESTGIIEVLVFSKQICPGWNNGKAMIGIQNFDKTKGQIAPGRGALDPPWGTVNMNEGWRFVPSKGASLLKRVELYDQTGTLVATGTTTDLGNGQLEASFPNICAPANATTTYIVRPVYTKIDDPAVEVFGADTVRVTRSPATNLSAVAAPAPATCGLNNGSITINIPAATGVAPFQYSIDGGALQSSNVFTNLAAGPHNVHVQDAGGCFSDLVANITTSGTMALTHTVSNATCAGASNGSITVTPPSGVPPITYSINNGPFVTNNIFSGLAAGTYQVKVKDGGTCEGTISNIVITAGPSITMTTTANPASCPGSNNGSITVTGATGTPPFEYSINSGTFQSNPVFSNLIPATYFLLVRDAAGCVSSTFHVRNVPAGNGTLTGTAAATGTTCGSLNNGSITITATAGSGPYEYSIDNGTTWQTSNVFSNLASNTYSQIRIRENGTCLSGPISATVTAGTTLTGTATSTAASCTGATNGSVTVTATSGSGPYEYSIDNGATWQTSNVFNGLAANTYTARVRQGGTCSSNGIPVTVVAGSTVAGTTATIATSCNGASNGSITVTATSGTGPYEYSIDNGATWQVANTFNGLAANTYSVRIRENGLCTSNVINTTVAAGSTLTGTVTPTATSCNGASNGSITVTATSGTGPYEYSVDNGSTWQVSNTFNGLAANIYSVRIRENGVCTSNTINANVNPGATITGTVTPTSTSCNGASNGSITVTPISGIGPYEYSIDNGTTWQASNTFNGLAVNTYPVRIRENGVCTSNTINANVTAGSTLTGTVATTATSCNGASNGSITVTATSGTGPYEYSIDNGSTWQPANTFNGLAANSYSVRIRENGVCTSNTITATVNAGSTLTGTVVANPTSCNGANNGSITITATSGTGPYEYSIDNGATWQAGNSFTNLAANAYSVRIRENGVCTSNTINATVAAGSTLTGTATPTATSCSGANNGSITVTATSGSGPYEYSIDNGATWQAGNSFINLAANSYSVRIRENGVCTSNTINATVTAGAALNGTVATTSTACAGVNNGSITVTVNAGFTGPFEYSMDAGTFQTSDAFTNVAAGAHNIVIRNAAGCISPAIPATVAAGSVLTSTISSTPTSCTGATNGTITLTPTNGSAPYQYSLDGGANQASNIFTGVAPGSHNVIVTDAFGCVTSPIPVTVSAGLPLIAVLDIDATSCNGANDGAITVNMNNGTPPIQFSINGGAYQSSNTFSNLAPATYTINYIDALGCTAGSGLSVPVSAGPALSGTAVSAPTACAGVNNGSVTVTPNAGFTGPFEYSLDAGAFQTSNNFAGVAAGAHNVVIRNATGCTSASIPVSVATGSVLIGSATSANTSCSGAADGSITAMATNGSGPFQYSLDGGANQASNIFNNVTAGAHNIVITDNFGCTSAPIPVTVTAGTILTGTTTTISTACAGVNNGSITVTPDATFTGPFEYSLDAGAFQTSNIFNGVAAGAHNIIIRNAGGCTSAGIPTTVTTGTAVTGTITSTNTSCSGATDGSITATPTNGGSPYLYSLDGGANQASNIFTAVAAGPHNIVITDNFGCVSASIPVTVTAGAILNGTTTTTATACAGVNNGSITVTAGAGFTGPFEYSLDGGAFQTLNIFNGVSAAGHNVVIRNASGCSSQSIAVTVAAGTSVTGTLNATTTSCSGANDATITATPTNGSAPYQYSLDGGANQAGNVFNNVTAGAHNIVITDNFGCTSLPLPVAVNAGAVLTGAATSIATACAGVNNGSITVTPGAGFTGPFQYSLDGINFQASNSFAAVAAGNYNMVIRNAAGCSSANIPVTVAAGTTLNGTAASTVVSCNGGNDASITVTPTNGGAPYQYSLNASAYQAAAIFNNLTAGNYDVRIRDAFGCVSAPINVVVTEPAPLTVPVPAITPAVCNGANNGKITVNPTGGNTPYSYSLDNVNFQPTNIFNVPQGVYTVYVRDAKGCSVQRNNLTVTQPQALTANIISTTNATCNGGSDGTIEIAASGGTAPYQYSSNGTNFQATNILNVSAGTYNAIKIRDANNCEFTLPNTVIGLTDNLTLTTVTPAPICEGSSVQLQLNSNGASYAWDAASVGLSSLTIPDPVASPTTTTIYTVTATLGSCTRTATVTVAVIPAPIPDAGTGGTICFGQDLQLQGSGGTTYTWSPATYLDDATIPDPQSVNPVKTITYTLSVRDANDCPSLITDQVTVTVTPPIKVYVSPSDTVIYPGDQIKLFASITGTDTSYTWTPSTGLNNPNISNPVVSGLNVGDIIPYKVTVTTSAGCQGEASVTVRVYEGPDLYVPTAFTPNNDGKNDKFIPFPVGIRTLNYFSVFNRWGQRIYFTKTLNQGWDGTMAGVEQATGVYIWMAEAVTQDGRVIKKKGSVTLIR